jgi:hypothetical protein
MLTDIVISRSDHTEKLRRYANPNAEKRNDEGADVGTDTMRQLLKRVKVHGRSPGKEAERCTAKA